MEAGERKVGRRGGNVVDIAVIVVGMWAIIDLFFVALYPKSIV